MMKASSTPTLPKGIKIKWEKVCAPLFVVCCDCLCFPLLTYRRRNLIRGGVLIWLYIYMIMRSANAPSMILWFPLTLLGFLGPLRFLSVEISVAFSLLIALYFVTAEMFILQWQNKQAKKKKMEHLQTLNLSWFVTLCCFSLWWTFILLWCVVSCDTCMMSLSFMCSVLLFRFLYIVVMYLGA